MRRVVSLPLPLEVIYRNVWCPYISEKLECYHEFGNAFDIFAIKTCKVSGEIVGHLPREISRATKYLLDRGAKVSAELVITSNYRRSPLVQGGLEIECTVVVKMPGTVKNQLLMGRYLETVKELYAEPKNEVILGSFLTPVQQQKQPVLKRRDKEKAQAPVTKRARSYDISRRMFSNITCSRNNEEENRNNDETTKINEEIRNNDEETVILFD